MQRYSSAQIALHWLIALLIFSAFGLAWYFGSVEITSPATFKLKGSLIVWHKWVGITVLALVLIRLVLRVVRGAPAALPNQPAWQVKAAEATHYLLYALMVALPVIGWLLTSAKGYPVVLFKLVQLPDLVGKDEALGKTLQDVHEFAAYTLLALVALHAAAAIKHHFIDRDDTLKRMLPSSSSRKNGL
ncbi:cytochrome b [Andreprevotia chitinilytica]|uniref:cytochrome b n=1 Tax=Andreprevotia chitinilytica TaxID=396808 RepID=UPI00055928F3|nr:cytochrome b [Andreprevotia chitinilytica]